MRKKNLIDLTVGDAVKLACVWYFVKPIIARVDHHLAVGLMDGVAWMRKIMSKQGEGTEG